MPNSWLVCKRATPGKPPLHKLDDRSASRAPIGFGELFDGLVRQLKSANQAEMLRAIQAVAGGKAIFGPGIAKRVLAFFAAARSTIPSRVFQD